MIAYSYFRRPSEGLPGTMSETTMDVSPLLKCGLSLPPDTAMPNPWLAFAWNVNHLSNKLNQYKQEVLMKAKNKIELKLFFK